MGRMRRKPEYPDPSNLRRKPERDVDVGGSDDDAPPALPVTSAWTEWLSVVGPEERAEVAKVFLEYDVESPDGFMGFCRTIVALVFKGSVHPSLVDAIKPVLDHMFATCALKHPRAHPNSDLIATEMTRQIVEVKRMISPVQPTYSMLPDTSLQQPPVKFTLDAEQIKIPRTSEG